MKKSVFPFLAVAVLFLLLTHPALSFEGASRGLVLWYQTVLPTLLPFMICSKMIVSLGGIRLLTAPAAPLLKPVLRLSDGGCYVLVSGLLCGYPMGARNCGEFVKEGRISASEGRYLLSISNHPSPMFLLGYMAAAADPSIPLGLLLIAVYLPVIPIAFLSRHVYHVSEGTARNPLFQENRLSFDQSLMDCLEVMVKIGGYIMVFSILAEFIGQIRAVPPWARSLLLGITEITTGIQAVSRTLAGIPQGMALCWTASFGGLCGLFQTNSVLSGSGLGTGQYFLWKILHGLMSAAVFMLLAPSFLPG